MLKKVARWNSQSVKRSKGMKRVALIGAILFLAGGGVAVAIRLTGPGPKLNATSTAVTPLQSQGNLSPTSPAKEYIYVGGRLVATEEPAAVLSAPTNLRTLSSKYIGWTDNSNNETGFKIERSAGAAGPWTQVALVGPDITEFKIGLGYHYRVKATNAGGDSAPSNVLNHNWDVNYTTYYHEATEDFSGTLNPNGAWRYGYRASVGSAFILLPNNDNLYGLPAGMHTWYLPGVWNLPAVVHNGTGVPQLYFGATHPTTLLNQYPGGDGAMSVVRWTASSTGSAQITGRFEGLDTTTTGVSVVKNGTVSLLTGNITGFGNQAPFSLTVSVVAGDTIDFQVASNGDLSHDSTGLAVSVNVQGPPPPLTYNVVSDFSPTQNQGAAWAYGYRPANGAFAVLPNNDNLYGLPAGMHTWYLPGVWNLPAVIHNGTGIPQSYFGATHPTDVLNLYPGADSVKSVVRWTVPRAGTAQLTGRFEGLDTTTTSVSVVKNGTLTLFNGNVNGFGNQAPFSLSVAVVAGDTIEFQVGYNGDVQRDSTGLALAITLP